MMNDRIKSGIGFGICMAVGFVVQTLLMDTSDTAKKFIQSLPIDLISGALAGVAFDWIIGTSWFLKLTNRNKNQG